MKNSEVTPIQIPKDQPNFVATPQLDQIYKRAMRYSQAGLPVHFSGPTGAGKTTLAMYMAGQIGRPVILIHGDEQLETQDLAGDQRGLKKSKEVDNYIKSVLKTEESVKVTWVDRGLTVACKNGYTLLYDEFTRANPEANNILLSVLEEGMLDLPIVKGKGGHIQVSPDFRAIFTSNPEEYAGVHRAQDALRDRMITINLDGYDLATEAAIVQKKGNISRQEAEKIVNIVREVRKLQDKPSLTLRDSIKIAKVLNQDGTSKINESFVQVCLDVFADPKDDGEGEFEETIRELIHKYS